MHAEVRLLPESTQARRVFFDEFTRHCRPPRAQLNVSAQLPQPEAHGRRACAHEKAVALTNDRAILAGLSLGVTTLAKTIRPLPSSVREYDNHIKKYFHAHKDAAIFQSSRGAGETLAPGAADAARR
jgi:hypothetical protein